MFVFVSGLSLLGLHQRGYIPIFIAILVITDACIFRVKQLSEVFGAWLSKALVRNGYTDVEPMNGAIQLKKWTEQSWQFVMHVVFSIVEIYILFFHRPEWWNSTDSVWMPHPRRQWETETPVVHAIYLIQLVSFHLLYVLFPAIHTNLFSDFLTHRNLLKLYLFLFIAMLSVYFIS